MRWPVRKHLPRRVCQLPSPYSSQFMRWFSSDESWHLGLSETGKCFRNRLKVREKLVVEKLWTYEQSLQHVPLISSPLALRGVLCESLSGDCGLPRPLMELIEFNRPRPGTSYGQHYSFLSKGDSAPKSTCSPNRCVRANPTLATRMKVCRGFPSDLRRCCTLHLLLLGSALPPLGLCCRGWRGCLERSPQA